MIEIQYSITLFQEEMKEFIYQIQLLILVSLFFIKCSQINYKD